MFSSFYYTQTIIHQTLLGEWFIEVWLYRLKKGRYQKIRYHDRTLKEYNTSTNDAVDL